MKATTCRTAFMAPAAAAIASAIILGMLPMQSGVVATQTQPDVETPSVETPVAEAAILKAEGLRVCEWGFSKNMCKGELVEGDWYEVGCPPRCWTLVGNRAYLKVPVYNNRQICCNEGTTCDEARDLNGVLIAYIDFHIRENDPCPMRGHWEGKWMLYDEDSATPIADGEWKGTLGVGTHRPANCLEPYPGASPCNRECEGCYTSELTSHSEPGDWLLHVEGYMNGKIYRGEYADGKLFATMQGYYFAVGLANDLWTPDEHVWEFCGTMDGVIEKECY